MDRGQDLDLEPVDLATVPECLCKPEHPEYIELTPRQTPGNESMPQTPGGIDLAPHQTLTLP
jgi:hypothetical protein